MRLDLSFPTSTNKPVQKIKLSSQKFKSMRVLFFNLSRHESFDLKMDYTLDTLWTVILTKLLKNHNIIYTSLKTIDVFLF